MNKKFLDNNNLFIDIFTPNKLAGYALPKRIKSEFENGMTANIMLAGSSGLGKSSILKMLFKANNIAYYYLNASESGNVDTLRNEVTSFCDEVQLVETPDGPRKSEIKYVFFDEIDGSSKQFFGSLLAFMDNYSKNVRFAATTNHYNKLPDNIKSRFRLIDFNYANDEERDEYYNLYKSRVNAIITKSLEMTIHETVLDKMVKKNFPDFRGVLQDLEKLYRSGVENITIEEFTNKSYEYKDLFDLIIIGGKPEDHYKKIMGKYTSCAISVMDAFHKDFIGYIEDNHPMLTKAIPYLIYTIWEHQNSLPNVIDPAIAVEACSFKMMGLINNARK